MLIDDNPDLIDAIAQILIYEGFEVLTTYQGAEGLRLAQEHLPNAILCDMQMPGMNGGQVYDHLKAGEGTANIPFIFLTAESNESMMRGQRYLPKPVEVDDLLQAIHEVIVRQPV